VDIFRDRLPFEEAISDPKLLKKAWSMLSKPQQVVVKVFYGLPLEGEELDLWSAFQGAGIYDELGYLVGLRESVPYVPKEYDTLTGIIGRRSGKSDRVGGIIGAYEITLGGHSRFIKEAATDENGKPLKDAESEDAFWLYIAQDLATAERNARFIISALDQSPLLRKQIVKRGIDEYKFKNGIILRAEPPNIRTGRGASVVGMTLDELSFWYKDAKSANPDYEVVAALEYATMLFPDAKQVRITTPWTKEGLAYQALVAGTEGKNLPAEDRDEYEGHLVVTAPSAAMGNPRLTRKKLIRLRKRDPEKFRRESLAEFTDSQSSFLTWSSIEAATDPMTKRPRVPGVEYVAAIDPAFRHDSFVLTIMHNEKERGVVQDFVIEWEPQPGQRLNPAVQLDLVKGIIDEYGVDIVYSDQYQLESLQALAEDRDFMIIGYDLTTKTKWKVMKNLESLLNQKRLRLLTHENQDSQLKNLQKTLGPAGYISVSAPMGKKDDVALATALGAHQALQLMPYERPVDGAGARQRFISEADLRKLQERWASRVAHDPTFAAQQQAMQTLLAIYGDDDRKAR
jgi:hypothetical protein